jgi:branched-chain amino acid:cation transporter, LIVCS family
VTRSYRNIIVLGFALFAMFFGAGNLIFPPQLGRIFGDQFAWSTIGFLITAVGLPLLGVLAVAKAEGGIDHLARRVDGRVAKILSIVVMLAIGPLYAIPRTCATTFELGIEPNISLLGSWPFSFIYFGVVLFFALNPLSVVDRIGKVLTPLLLLSLLTLIVKGVFDPISPLAITDAARPFGRSLVEGYQTMDLIAATIFGIIILNELRSKGIFNKGEQIKAIVWAGVIAAIGLAVVYSGLLYLGATSGGIPGDLSRTELLHAIANRLLGGGGSVLLGVAVSMACLTTAIGLTVVCGEYFNKLTLGRLNYKAVCITIAAVSLILSNVGVSSIIKIAIPPLIAFYPVLIVLVVLCLVGKPLANRNIWRGAVAGAFIAGLIDAVRSLGMDDGTLEAISKFIPLSEQGLFWLIPAILLGGVGAMFREKPLEEFRTLSICPSQLATRVAIFDDMTPVFETTIPHQFEDAMDDRSKTSQLVMIRNAIQEVLDKECIDLSTIKAVVSRGGFLHPLPGGTYRITEEMITDLAEHAWRQHPSNWGAAIAYEIAIAHDIDSFIVDPVAVDEMKPVARFSGLPEIKRASIFHASNQKAIVRRAAKNLWKRYDQINAIVAHIGEGTSVGAHERGRVVDVNNALDGDGPFSALNAGSLPTVDVVKMCFADGATEENILNQIRSAGGLLAYLGTTDVVEIARLLDDGDEATRNAIEAMGYQVAKEVGALSTTLKGRVDAIAITGELAAIKPLTQYIRAHIRFIAPVFVYPGESETKALVSGTLRVLRKQDEILEYEALHA